MDQVKTKVKEWGNSFGVILPMRTMKKENLKKGSEILLTVQSTDTNTVADLMIFSKKHSLPKTKKTTKEIMKEIDRELWSE